MVVEISGNNYHGWLIVENGIVIRAASMLRFTIGFTYHEVSDVLQKTKFIVVVQ